MQLERFSRLTLAWHRLALEADASSFKREALARLEDELPFSAAWWGMGQLQGSSTSVLQSHLHNLPPEFITDWWRIADVDALARRVAEHPGQTVLDDASPSDSAAEDAFDERYGLSCALATRQADEATGLHSFVSLYRHERLPPFTEQDRALVELLVPHLLQAEQLHWRLGLGRRLPAERELLALVDATGQLAHATPAFCRALIDEFPDWNGSSLPAPVLPLWRQRGGQWQGRQLELSLQPTADGGCAIELVRRLGHGLTRREEMVARAFAAGESYKEIARRCDISPATVRSYLRDCYLKLGVNSKSELGGVVLGHGRGGPPN